VDWAQGHERTPTFLHGREYRIENHVRNDHVGLGAELERSLVVNICHRVQQHRQSHVELPQWISLLYQQCESVATSTPKADVRRNADKLNTRSSEGGRWVITAIDSTVDKGDIVARAPQSSRERHERPQVAFGSPGL
jgi:hypothetical protein